MKREIVITSDGSSTIYMPELEESYHSKHGAIQEANHVFIKNGLHFLKQNEISILEIGFGTGLNALITSLEAQKINLKIHYEGIEAFPVVLDELNQLNYPLLFENQVLSQEYFSKIHQIPWEQHHEISSFFKLKKRKMMFENIDDDNVFDLIYFDAFGFRVQPELWSDVIFEKMYKALKKGGVLVTYACRSSIKKAMIDAGFHIEKLAGPPGKREMLRAIKK
jgi:tRNA U34 5-methylaminomethyl-2-thiouridine-forming methyltransferase MnmC